MNIYFNSLLPHLKEGFQPFKDFMCFHFMQQYILVYFIRRFGEV